MTKMTNVKALECVLANWTDIPADVAVKLTAMKASFEKKSSAERKPTALQLENEKLKQDILTQLADNKRYTISDLIKTVPSLHGLSNQKVTQLVRLLKLDGLVERVEDEKRQTYFQQIQV